MQIHFGHKNADFQTGTTNGDLDADKEIFFLPSNSQKFSSEIQNQRSDFT